MAYEVFQRTAVRVDEPTLAITPDGRMVLNAAAARTFERYGVKFVLLLWDKSNLKIALKATHQDDKNAYAVSHVPSKHAMSLRAKLFLGYIGWSSSKREILPATWNDKDSKLEIALQRKHIK